MITKETEDKIKEILPTLDGWCTEEKALKMANLIRESNPKIVVEIGVFGGSSLVPQLLASKKEIANKCQVYGIDPYRKEPCTEGNISEEDKKWWSDVDLGAVLTKFIKNVDIENLWDYLTLIVDKAENVVHLFQDGSIDILHIDGCHSTEQSVKDFELWFPKVREGGYIWADDEDWTTTFRLFKLLRENCDEINRAGSCVLFQKRLTDFEITKKEEENPIEEARELAYEFAKKDVDRVNKEWIDRTLDEPVAKEDTEVVVEPEEALA